MSYITAILDSSCDRRSFTCGVKMLDDYFHNQANQDMKRKLAVCFVMTELDESKSVIGFYTLSNSSIPQQMIPEAFAKNLPKSYTNLPVTLLGRLAVSERFKGQGFGKLLLIDALKRSHDISEHSIGSMAVIVDPFDKNAFSFYSRYGFIELPGSGKMFMALKTITRLFNQSK